MEMTRRKALAAGASVASAWAQPSRAADFNLRLATQYNSTQPNGQGYDRWAQAVTERSNGRLAVRVFHNRTLIDSVESFAAVKSGSVDASNMIAGFQTGDLPDLSGLQLPFLFADNAHYRRVLRMVFLGISDELVAYIGSSGLPRWEILASVNVLLLLLGTVMDGAGIVLVMTPTLPEHSGHLWRRLRRRASTDWTASKSATPWHSPPPRRVA